ncbi:MAG TPA: EamA family transporter [Stellaceae bacterium]|jgi:O-acetylserine/cysteine efflux transporter
MIRPADIAAAVVVAALWGLNFPVMKLGLGELPPMLLMALRFTLVALLLCPFRRLPREKLGAILLLSITLGSLHFSLMFSGVAGIDAATAALLAQSQVPFATMLAAIFLKDRLTVRAAIGMAVAAAGLVLIVGEPRFTRDDAVPICLVLVASFVWAVGNVQIKRLGAVDSFAANGWIAFFAAPQLLILSLLLERDHVAVLRNASWVAYAAVAYAAIAITIGSYALWYRLMRRYPVSTVMPFTLLVPVFGVLASMAMLGNRMSWQGMLGGVATLLGVAVIVLRRHRPQPPLRPAAPPPLPPPTRAEARQP